MNGNPLSSSVEQFLFGVQAAEITEFFLQAMIVLFAISLVLHFLGIWQHLTRETPTLLTGASSKILDLWCAGARQDRSGGSGDRDPFQGNSRADGVLGVPMKGDTDPRDVLAGSVGMLLHAGVFGPLFTQ